MLRRLAPAAALLMAIVAVWCALRSGTRQLLGPRGFTVVVTDAAGRPVGGPTIVPILLTPEVAPTPPEGGTLVARATLLARASGTYTWQLGGTSPVSLSVDGVPVYSPRPGRVAAKEQLLGAGPHALEVRLVHSDAAGGVALALRPPSTRWHSPLVDTDDVTTRPPEEVSRALGAHPALWLTLLAWTPLLGTALLLALALLLAGRAGRRRLVAYTRTLAADRQLQRIGMAAAVTLVVLPMIAPLRAPGFYACHEEESYIVRLGEHLLALRGGVPMGRWWPDPVLGRGYPFLCLYAPLLYIVAAPLLLAGVAPLTTVKVISAALVFAGAAGTYGIARRRASRPAALAAVTLFVYAPYLQTNLWIREDLAESLGFACFPLALWALERALDAERRTPFGDVAWLALALAALGSCHNITAYFSVYYLLLWMGMRLALRTVARAGVMRAMAGGGLGLLLTVFYAVPAIGDAKRVWMVRVMTGYYNPFRNFVPIHQVLVAEPKWGVMPLYVGTFATLGIVAGVAAIVVGRRRREPRLRGSVPGARLLALLAACGVLLALLLATRPIGPLVVRYVPLAEYVQFPWRMFLFAACLAPLCAPAAIDGLLRTPRQRWATTTVLTLVVMAVMVPRTGPPAPLVRDRLDVQRFLRSLDIDYVTSMNEYLPLTVRRTVRPFDAVVHVIDGIAQLVARERTPGRYRATVDAKTPSLLEFNAHWFPGWRAEVDGAAHPIGPGQDGFDDGGLIRVRVPTGRHEVRLVYGRTPLRATADAISLATLALVLALFGLAARAVLRSRRAAQG